jgi:hypothetical protein
MATISLPARFYSGVPTTSLASVYVVPAGEQDVITSVTVSNTTDVAAQATLVLGGVTFFNNLDLAPRAIVVLDFKQVLNAGESIQIKAGTASATTAFISGVKVTNI